MSRIVDIVLDDTGLPAPSPEIEQERRVAIFDLLEDNSFVLPTREDRSVPPGPYRLDLSIRERLLVFDIADAKLGEAGAFHLSLGPFRQVVKDYFQICESYFDAVKTMPPARSRRSIWPGAASTTRVRGCCRSGWRVRLRLILIRRAACSP